MTNARTHQCPVASADATKFSTSILAILLTVERNIVWLLGLLFSISKGSRTLISPTVVEVESMELDALDEVSQRFRFETRHCRIA